MRELQIKTTPTRMAVIKKTDLSNKCWQECGAIRSFTHSGGLEKGAMVLKTSLAIPQEVQPSHHRTWQFHTQDKQMKLYVHTKTCTYLATSCMMAKTKKPLKRWGDKRCSICKWTCSAIRTKYCYISAKAPSANKSPLLCYSALTCKTCSTLHLWWAATENLESRPHWKRWELQATLPAPAAGSTPSTPCLFPTW